MRPSLMTGLVGATLTLGAVCLALASPPFGGGGQAPQPSPPPAVKVGEPAPDFQLPYLEATPEGKVQNKQVRLSEFKGKQVVVLAFFPAAFSPG